MSQWQMQIVLFHLKYFSNLSKVNNKGMIWTAIVNLVIKIFLTQWAEMWQISLVTIFDNTVIILTCFFKDEIRGWN